MTSFEKYTSRGEFGKKLCGLRDEKNHSSNIRASVAQNKEVHNLLAA
jgi:hypothetical protein